LFQSLGSTVCKILTSFLIFERIYQEVLYAYLLVY